MERQSEYMGNKDKQVGSEKAPIGRILTFDDEGVDRVAKKVFAGMKTVPTDKNNITKHEMRNWTQIIGRKKCPGKPFDEEAFERGFQKLDWNKDGTIGFDEIKNMVLKKVQNEGLYVR